MSAVDASEVVLLIPTVYEKVCISEAVMPFQYPVNLPALFDSNLIDLVLKAFFYESGAIG